MENSTEKTGWFVYYISDKSGIGYDKPNYINSDIVGLPDEDVRYSIIHAYEIWAMYSEDDDCRLRYEVNVMPPVEEVDKAIQNARMSVENASNRLHNLEIFKEKNFK